MKLSETVCMENNYDDYAGYMSTPQQQARIDKMWNGDGLALVYMWVKQNRITLKEFKELVDQYTKE